MHIRYRKTKYMQSQPSCRALTLKHTVRVFVGTTHDSFECVTPGKVDPAFHLFPSSPPPHNYSSYIKFSLSQVWPLTLTLNTESPIHCHEGLWTDQLEHKRVCLCTPMMMTFHYLNGEGTPMMTWAPSCSSSYSYSYSCSYSYSYWWRSTVGPSYDEENDNKK